MSPPWPENPYFIVDIYLTNALLCNNMLGIMLDSRDFEGLITSRKTSGVQINKQDDFNPWEAGAMRKGEEDNIVCVGGLL